MSGPHYWIATTPSSWVAGSFSTGLLPNSNEEVYFDDRANGSVIGGLNQTAVDLDLLSIDESYTGDIGSDGAPLIISADLVVMHGAGSLYYQDGGGTTDNMIVDSPNPQDAVTISGSTISHLRMVRGRANALATMGTILQLEMDPSGIGDAILSMARGAGTPTVTVMVGGQLTCYGLGTTVLSGGVITLYGNSGALYQTGGYLNWAADVQGAFSPDMGPAYLMRGTMDTRTGIIKSFSIGLTISPSFELIGVENRHWTSNVPIPVE